MGLTAVQEDIVHVTSSKREGQAIDALVLTKSITQQTTKKLWVKNLFDGWDVHLSSKGFRIGRPRHDRQGLAGVIVAC